MSKFNEFLKEKTIQKEGITVYRAKKGLLYSIESESANDAETLVEIINSSNLKLSRILFSTLIHQKKLVLTSFDETKKLYQVLINRSYFKNKATNLLANKLITIFDTDFKEFTSNNISDFFL